MRALFICILTTIAVAAASIVMSSCNTSGCTENQSSIPLAGFYGSADGRAIAIDSVEIGGVGAPNDSLLAKGRPAIKSVYLPLRAADGSTTFYFKYIQKNLLGLADYVTLTYEAQPFFASEECGAMYCYRITACDYTTVIIDHIEITDSLITNADVEKIKIYFRTADE